MARCALILKISLAMLAFAANSILCRLALQGGHIDPLSFSSLRLASGAFVLSPFLFYHARTTLSLWRPLSGFYLMAYAVLFSVAYIHLDTGAGALLLFGAVQFAMVIHGLFKGESLSAMRACGLVLALTGIAALLLCGLAEERRETYGRRARAARKYGHLWREPLVSPYASPRRVRRCRYQGYRGNPGLLLKPASLR